MEMTKLEVDAVEKTLDEKLQQERRALTELQLALVGGGIGDVIVG
jgi:hypothetical protein